MIATVLLAALSFQDPPPPAEVEPPAPRPTETTPDRAAAVGTAVRLVLGRDRTVSGTVLKETDEAVFVDLGFDVLRVPQAAILSREPLDDGDASSETSVDHGIYLTGDRPEMSIAEGAASVGESVVKIESSIGSGSGFITNDEGYVVTNFHVVDGDIEVDVIVYLQKDNGLDKRTIRDCKVVAINPAIDLALVKVEAPKDVVLTPSYLGDSEGVRVGDRVYAIGAPIGLERTVSSGIVSVANRSYEGHTRLQITTPINPGNSGGPLFNLRGEVVGVNSSGYLGMQGLNFAIPSKYVADFLRNRDAFALDTTRSENGIHYLPAPARPKEESRSGAGVPAGGRDER